MKLSAKPILSPGRTDKFPPPLMRFLRSNAGSRSRGRSRSSPMFLRKKTTVIETQEPSSPKVTCMGQVRVRRSSKQKAAKRGRPDRDRAPSKLRRCWLLRHALLCRCVAAKIRPRPKWGFFRMANFRRKARQDSARTESNCRERYNVEAEHEDIELEEENYEERANANVSTPPRNAFLLTRCRSAPYRSSSLASRFWGSPLRNEETGEKQRTTTENREPTENEKPSSQIELISDKEGSIDPKTEEKYGFFKELEDSIKERIIKSENVEESKKMEERGDSARPLILTRCKSEPARIAQKLDPELNFWRKRRVGLADSWSSHDL